MRLPPFQEFLNEHRDVVCRFLVAAVGPDEADDCFQETFMAALRAYPRAHAGNMRSWVLTIANRKALDAHRSRRRRPRPEAVLADGAAPEGATPEPALWKAVDALAPRQREAVLYRFAGDLAFREVARLMGCSEAAARRNVHDGVKRLREVWRT